MQTSADQALSVIILTMNEEEDLPEAMASVREIASEIVVVDSGSSDRTVPIAKELGAKVFTRAFDQFSAQRRFALECARGPWILSLDADERVDEELRKNLARSILEARFKAFSIDFNLVFMGRKLSYIGSRERHLRLFRKDAVTLVSGLKVHERYAVRSAIGRLKGKITHRPYKDLWEYFSKCETYTSLAANEFVLQGKKWPWWHAILPFYEFIRCAVFKLGVLDGFEGLVWSTLSAYHRYVRSCKIKKLLCE